MKKDASMLVFLTMIALVSAALAPSEPSPPVDMPPPVVDTVDNETLEVATSAAQVNTLEGVAGLALIGGIMAAVIAFKVRRRRRNVIRTDNASFIALMRRLDTMSKILEGVTDE